jgi:hypothetical protein
MLKVENPKSWALDPQLLPSKFGDQKVSAFGPQALCNWLQTFGTKRLEPMQDWIPSFSAKSL